MLSFGKRAQEIVIETIKPTFDDEDEELVQEQDKLVVETPNIAASASVDDAIAKRKSIISVQRYRLSRVRFSLPTNGLDGDDEPQRPQQLNSSVIKRKQLIEQVEQHVRMNEQNFRQIMLAFHQICKFVLFHLLSILQLNR